MSSVGIHLINFGKRSSINVSHCQILRTMLCFVRKIIFFISSSFIRIIPAETPIFYQYSTSDQLVFVKKALFCRPPFCFPEFAGTVRLHSETSLHHLIIDP